MFLVGGRPDADTVASADSVRGDVRFDGMALWRGLRGELVVGTAHAISLARGLEAFPLTKETAMKTETFLLKSLFVAAVLLSVLTMGAMVTTSAPSLPASVIAAQ